MFKKVNTCLLIKIKWLYLIQLTAYPGFKILNFPSYLKNSIKINRLLKFIPKRLNIVNIMNGGAVLKRNFMPPSFFKERLYPTEININI